MSSEQLKEYCEHWVVCKHAHALLYCPVDATGKHHKECEYDTRSRPAPAPCPYNASDDMCLECKKHEQRIADEAVRKAREDVLDEIDAIAKKGMKEKEFGLGEKYCREYPEKVNSCWHGLHRIVESLRSTQHQAGEQHE